MKNLFLLPMISLLIGFTGQTSQARQKAGESTITLGRSETLSSQPVKKRSFKMNAAAVSKAHAAWKKAHLNTVLYACQRNSEQIALLARKVADKIEASEKETTSDAKNMGKILESAIGEKADEPGLPEQITGDEIAQLKEKIKLIESAQKHGAVLEHLAGQVMNFYLNDVPKTSAYDGSCRFSYTTALQKGVAASKQYHSDALALSQDLNSLEKLAKTGLSAAKKRLLDSMIAAAQ